MAVNVWIIFDPDGETLDGKGWKVTSFDDTVPAEVESPTVTYYLTLTAAATAIEALFSADPSIVAYFQSTAEATVLAAEAATVDSTRDASITAEGLTP